ncbi:hypothetical protein KHA80_05540 [Anaerobacillus sp. HL2]|nr:hypothetical protein KHA80_05540 [Anaerobacillus sp. HL2]
MKKYLPVLKNYLGKVHDIQYGSDDLKKMIDNEIYIETIILSTTSTFAENDYSIQKLIHSPFSQRSKSLLLKENRGGSTYYDIENKKMYEAPAFSTYTIHSVGGR